MLFGQAALLLSPVPSMKDPGPSAGSGGVPVRRPAHRIGQHAVGVNNVRECLAVAGLLVIRVVKGGEQPVRLGYDQGLGRPAHLKHLVVVGSVRSSHWTKIPPWVDATYHI